MAVTESVNAADKVSSLGDYFEVFRRHWVWLATVIPGALLLAIFLAYYIEPQYEAIGTIMLEASSVPKDVIATTVVSYADQQIELIRGKVLTSENLKRVVAQVDPYPDLDISPDQKAAMIADNTTVERVDPVTRLPVPVSNAFAIHYVNPNPHLAKKVCDKLDALFLTYNQETRTAIAAGMSSFLQAQADQAQQELRQGEAKLQAFKQQHPLSLPDDQIRNQLDLDRLHRESETYAQQIVDAQTKEAQLSLQLSQTNPNLYDPRGDWQKELVQLRSDLAVAQQKYTQDHPDVKRLKKSIAALSARTDTSQPTQPPDNPDYLSVQTQLKAIRANLATMKDASARDAKQIQQIEISLSLSPTTDREYQDLLRNHTLAQDKYSEVQKKLQDAQIGQQFEAQQRGERLTLLQGPSVPSWPASPNRIGVILLGLVLGIGLACGIATFLETSDPTVRGMRDLQPFGGVAVIGTVPHLYNRTDRRRRIMSWTAACVVFAGATAITAWTVIQTQRRAEAVESKPLSSPRVSS